MVEGFTTTAARSQQTSTIPPETAKAGSSKKRATILGATVTAAGMRLGDKLARAIRHRAPWTRNATHDQLRWACADMGEQQWTEDQAVRFVVDTGHRHAAGFGWEPDRPHRLIAAGLRTAQEHQQQDQQMQADLAQAVSWQDSTARREAADLASLAALFAVAEPEPERTDDDRRAARLDWDDWRTVAAHYATDPDDALDLYGTRLCVYAEGQDARHNQHAYA